MPIPTLLLCPPLFFVAFVWAVEDGVPKLVTNRISLCYSCRGVLKQGIWDLPEQRSGRRVEQWTRKCSRYGNGCGQWWFRCIGLKSWCWSRNWYCWDWEVRAGTAGNWRQSEGSEEYWQNVHLELEMWKTTRRKYIRNWILQYRGEVLFQLGWGSPLAVVF